MTQNKEIDFQLLLEMSIINTEISDNYARESLLSGGKVDFLLKREGDVVLVETKVCSFNEGNLVRGLEQIKTYSEDISITNANIKKILIFFTTQRSFASSNDLVETVGQNNPIYEGTIVFVYRGSPPPSRRRETIDTFARYVI